MPAGNLTTKAKRRTILKRYRRAASFVRLCVLPHPDFTIPRSRRLESDRPYIASRWSSRSASNGALATSVSHRSLNSHRSRARGKHSPPLEASGSRQFLSPHYASGKHELERRSFPRYGELGVVPEPGRTSPDLLPIGYGSKAPDGSRTRTLSEPTRVAESPAIGTTKPRSVSQPVPPFAAGFSSDALNGTAMAKLLTPIMEDAPTLHANALLYPSFSSSLDVMHELPADDPHPQTDATDASRGDGDAAIEDTSAALPSVILTAATPFESGSEQPVLVFTPPTTPQKKRVSTASTETYATQNRRSDATVYLECESLHSPQGSPRNTSPSEDGVRGRRYSTVSEHHRRRTSLRDTPARRPSVTASQRTHRSPSRELELAERAPYGIQRSRPDRQSLTRRSSYESALSFSDSVALTLAYLGTQDARDLPNAPLSRRSSRSDGLRIATDISPVLADGPITEFSPTETAVGTPYIKGKGSDRRASWADKLANKLAHLVRSPTRTRSLRLSKTLRLSAPTPTEAPIPIPASA